MQDSEKLLNSILMAVANLDKEMRSRFESMEMNFKVIDQNFVAVGEQFERIDKRFEVHDLEIRKTGVLLEALSDKVDTVIEVLEGTRESLERRIHDHEKRITSLENR